MADIKVFKEGESILASDTNNNNNVLLSKINDHYTQVDNYVKGELGTIKSEVGSAKADLENKIEALDAKKPISIKEIVNNGYEGTILYSNNYCEQWGRNALKQDASATVTLHKPYINNEYNISAVMNSGGNYLSRGSFSITSVDNASFKIYNGQDVSGHVLWSTKGFVEEVE